MSRRRRPSARSGTRAPSPSPGGSRGLGFVALTPYLAVILLAAVVSFSPVLGNELVRWDDYAYIVDNPIVRDVSIANVLHIFDPHTIVFDNYHPLTILSYAIEYHLVGTAPALYHLDNLLLHLFNIVLVAYFVWLLTRRPIPALVTAALFAIHPMRVESVAWAAERKDLLYTFFFLLGLIAYALYARERGQGRRFYVAAIICLLLASLAKAQAVVLTFTFFLVDYWYGRRGLKRLVVEKVPFLALSAALGGLAMAAQTTSLTPARLAQYSILDRLAIANANLVAYLYKLVAPYELACFYRYPADLRAIRWAVVLVAGLALVLYRYGRRSRHAMFGCLFFLGTSLVVIQLLPIGDAFIADRFTYVPYLGLFFWFGHLVDRFAARPGAARVAVWVLVATQLFVFAAKTYAQTRTWRNTETLWRQVLRLDPDEPRAHNNLGVIQMARGETQQAMVHFQRSVTNGAGYDRANEAYRNLGATYAQLGRYREGIEAYDRAIRIAPTDDQAWLDRGLVRAKSGDDGRALEDFSRAMELRPRNAAALYARGNALRRLGRIEEAIADYSQAIDIDPTQAPARANRGNCFMDRNEVARAIEDYTAAMRLVPEEGIYYLDRSKAYYRLGDLARARQDYEAAVSRGAKDESYGAVIRVAGGS